MTRSQLLAALTDARTEGDLELADAIEAAIPTLAVENGHWPDCYVNHGPPDATCDMGPDCGETSASPEWIRAERMIAERRKA